MVAIDVVGFVCSISEGGGEVGAGGGVGFGFGLGVASSGFFC